MDETAVGEGGNGSATGDRWTQTTKLQAGLGDSKQGGVGQGIE